MRTVASIILFVLFLYIPNHVYGQINYEVLDQLLQVPRQYTVMKTSQKIEVDGQANEAAWTKAPWVSDFVDIRGGEAPQPDQKTLCKMLWDDDHLFVYALFYEKDIWATFTEHDDPIYHDNAFEIFFDPDDDGENYMEFQINANKAVFDFFFQKPYRSGGSGVKSWEITGLKKAVYVDGTINDPSDQDKFWAIELAIPLRSLINGKATSQGDIWRVNLSRVQWDVVVNGSSYQKKRDAKGKFISSYWVWSPQGLVNLHYPERWGYIRFGSETASQPVSNFLNREAQELKLAVWKYYYLQQDYRAKYGRYALNIAELEKAFPRVKFPAINGFFMRSTIDGFEVGIERAGTKGKFSVNHEGKQNNNGVG